VTKDASRFVFRYARAMAAYRAKAPDRARARRYDVAELVAFDGDNTTGTNCPIRAEVIANLLGISARSVERDVRDLVAEGLLVQTQKPTRGTKGNAGRKARYRATLPGENLSDDSKRNRATSSGVTVSDDDSESSDTQGHIVRQPRAQECRSPTSGGPTSVSLIRDSEVGTVCRGSNGAITDNAVAVVSNAHAREARP
jgi:hypothetical protein